MVGDVAAAMCCGASQTIGWMGNQKAPATRMSVSPVFPRQGFELVRGVAGADVFVGLELAPADFRVGLLRFGRERYFDVEPATGADQLGHFREDGSVVVDVLQALDRVDEVGRRERRGEIGVQQIALKKDEVRERELHLGLSQVDTTDGDPGEAPCEQTSWRPSPLPIESALLVRSRPAASSRWTQRKSPRPPSSCRSLRPVSSTINREVVVAGREGGLPGGVSRSRSSCAAGRRGFGIMSRRSNSIGIASHHTPQRRPCGFPSPTRGARARRPAPGAGFGRRLRWRGF